MLKDTLARLARSRIEAAERIGDYLVLHGEGPNKPTEEKELIKKAVTRAKSALGTGDSVLHDCRAEEARVRGAADAALAHEMERDLRLRLEALRTDADAHIRTLDDFLGAPRG